MPPLKRPLKPIAPKDRYLVRGDDNGEDIQQWVKAEIVGPFSIYVPPEDWEEYRPGRVCVGHVATGFHIARFEGHAAKLLCKRTIDLLRSMASDEEWAAIRPKDDSSLRKASKAVRDAMQKNRPKEAERMAAQYSLFS